MLFTNHQVYISNEFTTLKKEIASNTTAFLDDTYHYIKKYNDSLLDHPRFSTDRSYFKSVMADYSKKLNTKINEYIQMLVEDQIKEIKNNINDLLDNSSSLTIEEIETKKHHAINNITAITREKLGAIDGFIEDNIKDCMEEYNYNTKVNKLEKSELDYINKAYIKGISNNITSVKNKFADTSNKEITLYYENSYDKMKDFINGKDIEEFGKTESVANSNELAQEIKSEKTRDSFKVKVENLGLSFIDLGTLQLFLNSISNTELSEKDGYLIAKEGNDEQDVTVKEDNGVTFIAFHRRSEFAQYGAVELNPSKKTIAVKKNGINDGVVYDFSQNVLQVKTANAKYVFRFEDGLAKAYFINENGAEVELDYIKAIEEISNSGLNIAEQVNFCGQISLTKGKPGEARS